MMNQKKVVNRDIQKVIPASEIALSTKQHLSQIHEQSQKLSDSDQEGSMFEIQMQAIKDEDEDTRRHPFHDT